MYKNHIEKIRKEKGMTLQKLADTAGLSMGYICHLEKGSRNNPSRDSMEKISKALGKTVAEVFFE